MSIPKRVRRRDRLSIIAEILLEAQSPVLRTHMMYRLNLSFTQLAEYLKLLTERELIETIRDKKGVPKAYKTTEKGMMYLRCYSELRGFLKPPPTEVVVLYPERRPKTQ